VTRDQITSYCIEIMGEVTGTPGADAPRSWDLFITTAADELTRDTDSTYGSLKCDILTGVTDYCLPGVYKFKAATILSPTAPPQHVTSFSKPTLADQSSPQWRDAAASSGPFAVLLVAQDVVRLSPPPNYTLVNALSIEGYKVLPDWPLPTDSCPLPSRSHLAVVYGACLLRCIQVPSSDNMARLPMLQGYFNKQKGLLESEVRRQSDATVTPEYDNMPGRTLGYYNPLDL